MPRQVRPMVPFLASETTQTKAMDRTDAIIIILGYHSACPNVLMPSISHRDFTPTWHDEGNDDNDNDDRHSGQTRLSSAEPP